MRASSAQEFPLHIRVPTLFTNDLQYSIMIKSTLYSPIYTNSPITTSIN